MRLKEFLKGTKIITKYDPDPEINVGHDEIYVGDVEMTEPDRKKMDELGWMWDEDCWKHFV